MTRFPAVALLLLSVSQLVFAQPSQYCSNIVLNGSSKYDLSWWINKGPFAAQDSTGVYTFTFSLCSPLPNACMDTVDGGNTNACPTPGSATMCLTWPNANNPSRAYSSCCANANYAPSFAAYNQGSDQGIVMTVGGGDECGICAPSARATAFTIICDASTTPKIESFESANVPSPVYRGTIRHCSGCPTTDSRFCSGAAAATLNIAASVVGASAPTSVSLLPPSSQLSVIAYGDASLKVSGVVEQALNSTVDFLLYSSTGSAAVASLSFPGSQIAMMSLKDAVNGKSYPCNPAKLPRSASVAFACTFGSVGNFVVMGSIL